jgi:hypothetical protein
MDRYEVLVRLLWATVREHPLDHPEDPPTWVDLHAAAEACDQFAAKADSQAEADAWWSIRDDLIVPPPAHEPGLGDVP